MIDGYKWIVYNESPTRYWYGKITYHKSQWNRYDRPFFTGFYIRPMYIATGDLDFYDIRYKIDHDFSMEEYLQDLLIKIDDQNKVPKILVDYFNTNLWLLDMNLQKWKLEVPM